nr:MAG TPA: hypothetical protein [Caudoviricetes sp.]
MTWQARLGKARRGLAGFVKSRQNQVKSNQIKSKN